MSSRGSEWAAAKKRKLDPTATEQRRSYVEPVLTSHLSLLKQGTFADVTFIVGEMKERIPCHQIFLKARSPVFEVMFSERWNPDNDMEIPLEDVQPKTFKMFLQFIYADIFGATVAEALELLQLAHMYQVQLLVDKCEELLESGVTLEDAVGVFQAARKFEWIQLMDKVGDLWARSLPKMQTLPSFAQLDKETLMYILKRNGLEIKEVDLFRLALRWARNQTDATVEESLQDILPFIRFPIMTLKEFTATVVPTKFLSPTTVIELFTYFGTDDEAKESFARTLSFSIERRQPKDSFGSVALYPEDILNKGTTSRQFRKLKECLQFFSPNQMSRNLKASPNAGFPFKNNTGSMQPIQGIGLRGFSFYCPAKSAMTATPPSASSSSFKNFEIFLKSKDSNHQFELYGSLGYRVLLNLPSVRVEEEKITEIKFDTVIPLQEDTIYCITIQEMTITSAYCYGSLQNYNAKHFGTGPHKTVTVNIGSKFHATLAVHRNELGGFKEASYTDGLPHLICSLGFQEL